MILYSVGVINGEVGFGLCCVSQFLDSLLVGLPLLSLISQCWHVANLNHSPSEISIQVVPPSVSWFKSLDHLYGSCHRGNALECAHRDDQSHPSVLSGIIYVKQIRRCQY